MPCTVKKTFETARETGSFLVAQVKANQQTLHDTIEAICAAEKPIDSAASVDRNRHGRQEHVWSRRSTSPAVSAPTGTA